MDSETLLTPLSIVMAFIGVIEATLAYRVTALSGKPQMIFVWFMVTFPAFVLAGFFYVQLTNPLSWYPPSEISKANSEQLDYLDVQGRAQKTQLAADKLKAELAVLENTTDINEVRRIANELGVVADTFNEKATSDRIRSWLDSAPNHRAMLNDWIEATMSPPVPTTILIFSQGLQELREKAIRDLNIP